MIHCLLVPTRNSLSLFEIVLYKVYKYKATQQQILKIMLFSSTILNLETCFLKVLINVKFLVLKPKFYFLLFVFKIRKKSY